MFKRSAPRSNWNLEVLVFVEGETPEKPEKTLGTKRHETASTGIEPGSQRLEANAYPLRQPCSQ